MDFDRKYIVCSLAYATLGMMLGVYMGMSQNHAQFVTHAHILLVGFVVSFVYGVTHKLWLANPRPGIAKTQFYLHQVAALILVTSLFLMFGNFVPEDKIGPVLGMASIGVLIGLLLMLYMVINTSPQKAG
jgi:hypothetical protein